MPPPKHTWFPPWPPPPPPSQLNLNLSLRRRIRVGRRAPICTGRSCGPGSRDCVATGGVYGARCRSLWTGHPPRPRDRSLIWVLSSSSVGGIFGVLMLFCCPFWGGNGGVDARWFQTTLSPIPSIRQHATSRRSTLCSMPCLVRLLCKIADASLERET